MGEKGERYGTIHARNALQRRYKLDVPFKVFLDLIAAGKATEQHCAIQGRKVFDVYLEAPSMTVRTVTGSDDAGDENQFIITFLPIRWPSERSKLKHLNGRDKHKYHAVFRNVRLQLAEAEEEFVDEQLDEYLVNEEAKEDISL